jgi:hypothetical protein
MPLEGVKIKNYQIQETTVLKTTPEIALNIPSMA